MRPVLVNEATAAQRRVFFDCRDAADGITPEGGEAGGQPEISTDGGVTFTSTGIGVLVEVPLGSGDSGRYYAELTQTAVGTAGAVIQSRYKSANTIETPGTSVLVVASDPAITVWDMLRADHEDSGSFGEYVLASLVRFLGSTISETTPGRIAANFTTLFANADALSTLTLDYINTKLGFISAGGVTVSSSVDTNNRIYLYRAGAQHTLVTNLITFSVPYTEAGDFDLSVSGVTVTLNLSRQTNAQTASGDDVTASYNGVVASAGTTSQTITVDITTAEAATLSLDAADQKDFPNRDDRYAYAYTLEFETGGEEGVIQEGMASVRQKYG